LVVEIQVPQQNTFPPFAVITVIDPLLVAYDCAFRQYSKQLFSTKIAALMLRNSRILNCMHYF